MKKLLFLLFLLPGLSHAASNRYVVTTTTFSIAQDLIGNVTASSNTAITFTGINGNQYSELVLYADGVCPILSSVFPEIQLATGGGFISSNYRYQVYQLSSSTSQVNGSTGDTAFILSGGVESLGLSNANKLVSFEVHIHGSDNVRALKRVNWEGSGLWQSNQYKSVFGGGEVDTGSTYITGVQFLMSSSVNVASGTYRLYGIRNSQN